MMPQDSGLLVVSIINVLVRAVMQGTRHIRVPFFFGYHSSLAVKVPLGSVVVGSYESGCGGCGSGMTRTRSSHNTGRGSTFNLSLFCHRWEVRRGATEVVMAVVVSTRSLFSSSCK